MLHVWTVHHFFPGLDGSSVSFHSLLHESNEANVLNPGLGRENIVRFCDADAVLRRETSQNPVPPEPLLSISWMERVLEDAIDLPVNNYIRTLFVVA